jgi:hypothetical protein
MRGKVKQGFALLYLSISLSFQGDGHFDLGSMCSAFCRRSLNVKEQFDGLASDFPFFRARRPNFYLGLQPTP